MNRIDVLELRIHGIANAPPADALLATDEEIERADGDMQGSFWRIRRPPDLNPPDASAEASGGPRLPAPTAEAYWWGNQARTGASGLALVGRAIVHVGWMLVLPFGLCNLAYWARRDIKGEVETPELWHSGDGAGLIRVFALLQTLFYTVGLLAVSVHLIGIECFPTPEDGEPTEVCAALPGFLDFLVDLTPNARAALLSVVPIAVILFLYIVSRRARAGFHPLTSFDDELVGAPLTPDPEASSVRRAQTAASDDDSTSGPPRPALLGSLGFWQRPRTAEAAERTHLAAVFAFVLMTLALDAVLDATGLGLSRVLQESGAWRVAPFPASMAITGAVLVVCAVALAWGGALSGRMRAVRLRRGLATWLMVISIAAFAAWLVWACFVEGAAPVVPPDPEAAEGLSGMVVAPTVIAAVGALIALASLSWGYGRGIQTVCGVLILGALGFAILATLRADEPDATNAMTYIAAGLVVAAVIASYTPLLRRENRVRARYAGWRGNGAAVALLCAWFASLVITSLLVLGVYSWLSTPTDSTSTRAFLRTVRDAFTEAEAEDAPAIELPVFYSRFATMLVVILAVLLVAAVCALIGGLRRFPAFSLPGLMFPRDLTGEALAAQKQRDAYLGGVERVYVPGADGDPPAQQRRTRRARAVSSTTIRRSRIGRVGVCAKWRAPAA